MKADLYIIKAKTNMHVGSGDSDFGVIDNRVQRDVLTDYPTIYASSLKGALREHMESQDDVKAHVKTIFGGNDDEISSGSYKFFNANLLSIPVRSNKIVYYNATTVSILEEFIEYLGDFGIENETGNLKSEFEKLVSKIKECEDEQLIILKFDKNETESGKEQVNIEDEVASYSEIDLDSEQIKWLKDIVGMNIVIFPEVKFKEHIRNLPIIARNKLLAGKSQNLWYEEIVPRETRFYTAILKNKSDEDKIDDIFEGEFKKSMIQIGGNASIGQGYTVIERIVRYE